MKVHKRKVSGHSKENKKKRITLSNSPCLKFSFTEFPSENSNIKTNTLTKNKTSNLLQEITKKSIVNMLSLSNYLNFKKKSINTNQKIDIDCLFHEQSINNLLKLKRNDKKKISSKNKSRMKQQQLISPMTNDFSFSNSNPSSNFIDDNKKIQKDILKNTFNCQYFKTNTFSNISSNKNIINLKKSNINNQIKYYNIQSPKSTQRIFENLNFKFNELNDKLNIQLNQFKENKNKRYNSIQKIFEELILIIPKENKKLFQNILIGIHDIVNEYYLELTHLKEEYEKNKKKIISLENEQLYNLKLIKQKDFEIEKLKKKNSGNISIQEQIIISKSTNSSYFVSLSTDKDKSIEAKKKYFKSVAQNRIEEFNKKNIFDLNALYFYDKVNMKSEFNSVPKSNNGDLVPPLDLNFEKIEKLKEVKKKEETKKKLNNNELSFIQKVAMSFDID